MATAKTASSSHAGETAAAAGECAPREGTPQLATERPAALGYSAARLRIAVVCAVVLALVFWVRGPRSTADDIDAALALALGKRGLELAPGQVAWLAPPQGPLALRPALFVAQRPGELEDVYYAEVRSGGAEGGPSTVLDLFFLTNVTRSSSAAERSLTRAGAHVAFTAQVGEATEALVVLDTRGEPGELTRGWPGYARAQNAITNWQETGTLRGFGRHRYTWTPPAPSLQLSVERGRFVAVAGDAHGPTARLVVDPRRLEPIEGGEFVQAQRLEKGRPGTITWVVDTVRNLSFVGPAPIEWLEHQVFGFTDWAKRTYHRMVGRDPSVEAEMAGALAAAPSAAAVQAATPEPPPPGLLSFERPDVGFPPPPLVPPLPKPARGEGEWVPVSDADFVNAQPNAPPAFYQTFIRVDPEREYTSVYITLWDPRQVQLHLAMGTKEPESATGETGTGQIPRDPEVLRRLVGAFNGGFQALHGEFGMMAEGRVYLPPKPWAATVAVFEDGRVGMGSWPGPGRDGWDEERANAQIPPDMIAMRQNLTSVVEDERYNPWKRWWWGAAPVNAEEQTYIARSGLCFTREGFMAFLWGESMGPEELGAAMIALHCARGIHLDMNSKHTDFEFYKPFAPGEPPAPLGRPRAESEFEGPLERGLGFTFRARLAVKTMTPLRFPRYLGRDPRDFFFLTLKPVLPGPPLAFDGGALEFSTDGLPHDGWPAAFARARAGAGAETVWLVRIDPRRALLEPLAPEERGRTLGRLMAVASEAPGEGDLALYVTRVRGLNRYAIGVPPVGAVVAVRGPALQPGRAAKRALALDGEGYLLYAEAAGDGIDLGARLRAAGLTQALALPDAAQFGFAVGDGFVSVDGERALAAGPGIDVVAEARPAAQVMFADVTPMPYQRWGFLQGQRVRYFPSGPPRFRAPEEVLEGGAGAPAPDAGAAPQPQPETAN